MSILIDPPIWPAHGTLWSHLISDSSYAELHEFAAQLGVPRRSFDLDHYDIPESKYARAMELGALPVSANRLVRTLRSSGLRIRAVERAQARTMVRRNYLRDEWRILGRSVAPKSKAHWEELGTDLLGRWSEPHRHYHDAQHLEEVLLALNQLETLGERVSPVALLAAWFHDAIYRGEPGHDEKLSAELAVGTLSAAGVDANQLAEVRDAILATIPRSAPVPPTHQTALLLDADLAILGAHGSRYQEYASAVRAEYAYVPEADFREVRAEILTTFLHREAIYHLQPSRTLWEARARHNITQEIRQLRSS